MTREDVCREILERVAAVDRLRAIRDELRALEVYAVALQIPRAIRAENVHIALLSRDLDLPFLTSTSDTAAFARAQLGMPIDAPSTMKPPRPKAAWQRDLERAAEANAA